MAVRFKPSRISRFLILSSVGILAAACNDKTEEAAKAPPPPAVTVAGVVSKEIRQSTQYVGQIAAVDRVDLVARVDGFLDTKNVADGSIVKKGDLLFTIEKQQYQASLEKAKADVASAKADAALQTANEKRDRDLFEKGHVSEAAFQATQATKDQAVAAVQAAQAALSEAELNLSYTDIKAPFDGQLGKTAFSVGEVVGLSKGSLGELIRQAPVYVTFSVSEAQYLNAIKKHGIDPADLKSDKVPFLRLVLPNGETYSEKGKLVFIDNKVDSQTGTITIRGQFENQDHRLLPGVFVSTFIEAPVETKALLIPQAAVQRDQRGSFVLVVNSEQSVEQTYVELGAQNGADFIVTKGLNEGDRVITEGLQKVRAGVKVNPVPASKPVE
jgi:membrane fusion protein, multidrug efflux system